MSSLQPSDRSVADSCSTCTVLCCTVLYCTVLYCNVQSVQQGDSCVADACSTWPIPSLLVFATFFISASAEMAVCIFSTNPTFFPPAFLFPAKLKICPLLNINIYFPKYNGLQCSYAQDLLDLINSKYQRKQE